ncbi:MAG: DNA-directed RNA polymerase subunit alpha [Desulfuromonadaceae bacterium]|nr:DNA-directed RNA polymerase subunit alpha [Desulfuromonadaceae bacterium]
MYSNWHDHIKPSQLQADEDTLTATYGKFYAEPFENGFGTILGNSLRRVLLSSIRGAAITSLRIKGVLHEFSAIQGVTEDVTEIILNLKAVRFKLHSTEQATVHIKCKGAGVVTAGSIITGHNVDVMNPDKYIATCGADANLDIEMTIKIGRGYVPAERNRSENDPVDSIVIDSIYTPIKKVNFSVSTSRAGQSTDYDNLALEVWTDGSVTPEDAVAYAAKILKEQLTIFVNFDEEYVPPVVEDLQEADADLNEYLYRKVTDFELSVRSGNALKNAGITVIGELVIKSESEMLKTKNFGRNSLTEMKDLLSGMGLCFGMKIPNFPDPELMDQLDDDSAEDED